MTPLLVTTASAALRLDGTTAAAYEQHSLTLADAAVAVKVSDPDGTIAWTGAARAWMNIDGHQTQVLLSAAHVKQAPTFDRQILQVALGADFHSPDEVVNVRATYTFPTFDRNNIFFSTDLMVIVPEHPFAVPLSASRTIGSTFANDVLSAGTYDDDGTPSTGLSPQNGKRYSFDAVVRSGGSLAYSNAYSSLRFSTINVDDLVYEGRLANHGSGSGSFNSAGQLVLMNTGASSDSSIGYRLDQATDWIAQTYRSLRLPGDATYDDRVNFDDLLVLAQHYNLTTGQTWSTGDFTGDAKVNFDDLLLLAQNYGGGASVVPGASPEFAADWQLAQSLVPEPCSLVCALAAAPLLGRRHRAMR